ncbi:MAG TPA: RDD family protein [Burkholderiaceae bacterium]|nr:RDD family protein [Burkholderiaceae bacterium]
MSTPRVNSPEGSENRPAGLAIRLAAMTYEAVLLFGVAFVVTYAVLALARWTYPMSGTQRAILQALLFVTLGIYFVYQWGRSGQTLAMKSWHLRLLDKRGRPPGLATAVLRYVLAWHLLIPGAIWVALFGGHGLLGAVACTVGFVALLMPALADSKRRLLHDRLTSTRIVRER